MSGEPDGPQWEGVEAAELLLLLERVAQECVGKVLDAYGLGNSTNDACARVLEERLGPLLRAGLAARTSIGRCALAITSKELEIIEPAMDRCVLALSAWNTAWRDAKREKGVV
jgi:hypothetical protein